MKKRLIVAILIAVIAGATFTGILLNSNYSGASEKPTNAYVGVTYCGNSVLQAKQLIDKVKGYTNLFCLQSGELQRDLKSVDEIGDYAVSQGMYFQPYFGNFVQATFSAWLQTARQKWGDHLLGIYHGDEPGGKMLDGYVEFKDALTGDTIAKTLYGDIAVQKSNGIVIQYQLNGDIKLYQPSADSDINNEAVFHPDGKIEIIRAQNGLNDFSYKSYKELSDMKPFKTLSETVQRFVARDKSNIDTCKTSGTKVFTSDYALYWFDYLAGYDVVLSQIGWNMSFNKQIALLRGAATAQHKDWGIIITWKYQQPPYLDKGTVIYEQMRTSYECGAKYLIVFNYYDENSPEGTLKEEHFQALQSFWKNVLLNSEEVQGSVKAEAVLIMPKDYGWGTRWNTDHIWGLFPTDDKTQQIWNLMEDTLQKHGLQLDIVYSDEDFPLAQDYQTIYRCD